MLKQSGRLYAPPDSGNGDVNRPRMIGPRGGRLAGLETFFDFFINNVPPPDEAKQMNPNIEQIIRMHADVQAAHKKRVYTVSAMPWRVEPNPDGDDPFIAKQVADHCRKCIKDIPNFSQAIEFMQYAVLVGGQGLEVTWHQDATGVETPVSFHPVHMSRFAFDRLGNMALLTRTTPVWGAMVSGDPQSPYTRQLPRGRFIYHIHEMGQGQWDRSDLAGYEYYGIGLDVPLYYVVTFDVYCLKFRMKFLERYGIPPTILYYPQNANIPRDVQRIADSLRGESLVTIPRLMGTSNDSDNYNSLYKVEQMPVPSGTYDFFAGFSDGYTLPRVNAIMLGSSNETKSTEEQKGGYSEHVSRKDAGPNVWFKRDAANISSTLTQQFIPAIVLGKYPGMPKDYWPIFSIEPKEEKDRMQELQIVEAASKMVPVGKAHVYDAADLPQPTPDEVGKNDTVGGQGAMGSGVQGGMPGMQIPGVPGAVKPNLGGIPKPKPFGFPAQPGEPKQGIGEGLTGGAGAVANQ